MGCQLSAGQHSSARARPPRWDREALATSLAATTEYDKQVCYGLSAPFLADGSALQTGLAFRNDLAGELAGAQSTREHTFEEFEAIATQTAAKYFLSAPGDSRNAISLTRRLA